MIVNIIAHSAQDNLCRCAKKKRRPRIVSPFLRNSEIVCILPHFVVVVVVVVAVDPPNGTHNLINVSDR